MIYVSLKYTRTVDVFKSIIERIVAAYDFAIESMLDSAGEETSPPAPKVRCTLVEKNYPDDKEIKENLEFYLLLRRILRAPYDKRNEFRRHVTLSAHLDDDVTVEVNIDIISEYYEKVKEFLEYVNNLK